MKRKKEIQKNHNNLGFDKPLVVPQSANGISRRDFLRKGAIAAVATPLLLTALPGKQAKASETNLSGWPDRYAMMTDVTRCIGCRRCEEACNKVNNMPEPEIPFDDKSVFEKVRRTDESTHTIVNRYYDQLGQPVYLKVQCNHCAEPACASACPVAALTKSKDGPVVYNEDLCIGCRYCMTACPYFIPAFEYANAGSPAITKCQMCFNERITKGQVPACATECPVEAISFGKRTNLIKTARERIRTHPHKYIDHIYGETEIGGTDWLYISGVEFNQLGFPDNLGTVPLPELTRDFLSLVPAVLVIWPALLGGFYLFSKKRVEQQNSITKQDTKHKEET